MGKEKVYGVWAVRSGASIFGCAEGWCKEDGKPLEFDTEKAAQDYADEAGRHATANISYYVEEKEPEPGAIKKCAAQPDLDARTHEETAPRNDAAEKRSEIPGRQIKLEADPLVEIRSAVHSNYAEFLLSKRQYANLTGRDRGADDVIAYHLRQAFKPGEVTPEEANQIGRELALKLTKGNHAFVVCTHVDKHHVHNHIIINSTTLDCQKKFRNFWGSTFCPGENANA